MKVSSCLKDIQFWCCSVSPQDIIWNAECYSRWFYWALPVALVITKPWAYLLHLYLADLLKKHFIEIAKGNLKVISWVTKVIHRHNAFQLYTCLLCTLYFKNNLIYSFYFCCAGSSLYGLFSSWGKKGLDLVAMHGLLLGLAPLVAEL